MKKVLILVFLLSCLCVANAQDERELFLWNTTSVTTGIRPASVLCLSVRTQYQPSERRRDLSYLDLSWTNTLNSWLKLGLAYRSVQTPRESGDVYEYRPQAFGVLYNNKRKVQYSLANRMEYRLFNRGETHFRYYNNFFVYFPAIISKLPKPYAGEELFTKLNGVGLHLARLYGGLRVWECNSFDIDLYYIFQKSKTADQWNDADILGMNLKFKI
ncbi:DUF2490 domain-containing protein [Gaoshiqia sp. Z1-71]|uniref:DUF2490 domain-containing protein n=1 Tax=Gaoshiqia hydrogeniformans TaxID=3290090 RepID=UPI003BF88814